MTEAKPKTRNTIPWVLASEEEGGLSVIAGEHHQGLAAAVSAAKKAAVVRGGIIVPIKVGPAFQATKVEKVSVERVDI